MMSLAFLVLAMQLTIVAVAEPESSARPEQASPVALARADIVDRNGNLLATNAQTHSIFAHPHEMTPEGISRALGHFSEIFPDLDLDQLERNLRSGRKFVWVRRRISPRQMQAVNDIGLPGLHFGRRQARIYPNGRLAAHILGGTRYGKESVRSAEIVGIAGVELEFDSVLQDPQSTSDAFQLSIDLRSQEIVGKVLAGGVHVYQAKAGGAVLMNVKTGEILALASVPDFDPNNRMEYFGTSSSGHYPLFNMVAQGIFELGSTFKVFAAAQALDLGLVEPGTMIKTTDVKISQNTTISNAYEAEQPLTVEDVIVKSSNTGIARIGLMIGARRQKEFMERLGFLEPTSLELAEAATVKTLTPTRWSDHATATVAFGHGLAVSPVHLAAAYASLVNGGCRVAPTIRIATAAPSACDRVVSLATSRQITRFLGQVVERGTARRARLSTIAVGGKTGTADKSNPDGGYFDDRVIATFAAVFPVDDPQYVLILMLDEPTADDGTEWQRSAGNTAVPVAAEIISRIAPFLLSRPFSELVGSGSANSGKF